MSFNNRYAFLKHKYYHISITSSINKNKITNANDKSKKDLDETYNKKSKTSFRNNKIEKIDVDDDHNQIYDSNTLYKRCLLNRETLPMYKSISSTNSQLAICTAKAKSMSNGSINGKEEMKSTLVKLLNNNSCCEICRKCIWEKKKLIAHRKICLLKFKKKNEHEENEVEKMCIRDDLSEPKLVNNILAEKNQDIHKSISLNKSLNLNKNIEKIISKKKKKKIKSQHNSIDLSFLYE